MAQQTTSSSSSALYEKIAKISAKLEEATPSFNGAVATVPPAQSAQPAEHQTKPWARTS